MEYRHEIINFEENLPVKFFAHRIGEVNLHWHESSEFLIVVDGEVKLTINSSRLALKTDDVVLINPNEPHSLYSENAIMIAVQFNLSLFPHLPEYMQHMNIECTGGSDGDVKIERLKRIVATLLKVNISGGKNIQLLNYSLCYRFIYELYTSFKEKKLTGDVLGDDRINNILKIIYREYKNDISLNYIASQVYISVPYMAKIFKETMGITVGEYLRGIRLHHAKQDLISTDRPIQIISDENGFPNQRAFISAFKDAEGVTPTFWRKKNNLARETSVTTESTAQYYVQNAETLQNKLSDFIDRHLNRPDEEISVSENESEQKYITIDNDIPTGSFSDSFKMYIGVPHFKELLMEDIRAELTLLQRDIGFRYIKMHGLFDDSLMIYNEDAEGNPVYNFSLINNITDFVLSLKLKPVIEFSFMPKLLAKSTGKTVFVSGQIISEPKSMQKYTALITAVMQNFIERYGVEEIKNWMFSVWNEPSNLPSFGIKYEQFFEMYRSAYKILKRISTDIKICGPNEFLSYKTNYELLLNFLDMAKVNECLPDMIDIHYYDTNIVNTFFLNGNMPIWRLNTDADALNKFIDEIKNLLNERGYGNIPIHFIEWNSTASHRDLLSDTCFKSGYIVKNILQNHEKVSGWGYWLLSDMHFENTLADKIFHGGLGLFTVTGGKKPAYYAYCFLNQLYKDIVASGDGYIVTKQFNEYALLLYNHFHFSEAYANEVGINVSYKNRYSVFPKQTKKKIELSLKTSNGKYKISSSIVNRDSGSIFDTYLKMGLTEPLDENEIKWLNDNSAPDFKVMVQEVKNNNLKLSFELDSFEIRLVKIKYYEKN